MKLVGDAAIVGPVDVRLGLTYTPEQPPPEAEVQPHFGANVGLIARLAQVGVHAIKIDQVRTGALALAGVAYAH